MLEVLLVGKRKDGELEDELYYSSITHHLIPMAKKAHIYECLWEPEILNITKAKHLIDHLQLALTLLRNNSDRFRSLENKKDKTTYGNYADFYNFVKDYMDACKQFPYAEILTINTL